MKKGLTTLLVFACSTVWSADYCYTPSASTNWYNPNVPTTCGNWEIGGEWIYFQNTLCDLNYAITNVVAEGTLVEGRLPGQTVIKKKAGDGKETEERIPATMMTFKPKRQPGFRIAASRLSHGGCRDLTIQYTKLLCSERREALTTTTPSETARFNAKQVIALDRNKAKKKELGEEEEFKGNKTKLDKHFKTIELTHNDITNQDAATAENSKKEKYLQDAVIYNEILYPTYGDPRYFPNVLLGGTDNDPPAKAEARLKNHYDTGEIAYGARTLVGCDIWLRPFIGIHAARIAQQFEVRYDGRFNGNNQSFVSTIKDYRRLWGIGPMAGVEARMDFIRGFGIGGKASVGLLGGRSSGNYSQTDLRVELDSNMTLDDQRLATSTPHHSIALPFLNLRLGINYTFWVSECMVFVGEGGYEMISYMNALERPTWNGGGNAVRTGATTNDRTYGAGQKRLCQSYNLHGWYFMGRLVF